MAKIVAIVNQKGGVGKTTSCVNLAAALKAAGQRILLCDFDPQANATSGMGVDKTVSNGIYAVLINNMIIAANIHSALFSVAAYTVILCFSLFKTGSLAKSLFNAH